MVWHAEDRDDSKTAQPSKGGSQAVRTGTGTALGAKTSGRRGHGSLLTLLAVVFIYFEEKLLKTKLDDIVGMAFGGWSSGWIFDVAGSYQAAVLHGIAWNVLNVGIMVMILFRSRGPRLVKA